MTTMAKRNLNTPDAEKAEKYEAAKQKQKETLTMLVNPLNPYSWALYFLVGINLYAATQQ